jgi:UTP--glucose-1-phosphate uridylyltransferase
MMIRKAVIPAAGFGTRFLPATKSQPKEMLPIVDTPVIQYVVEEAVQAGITDILMIIGKGKRSIEEHFDRSFQLEAQLMENGKIQELQAMRRISELADIHFVWQKELKGLGDAIYCARHHVQGEPFAVLLGDTLIDSQTPAIKQLANLFDRVHQPVVLLEQVAAEKVHMYGVIDGPQTEAQVFLVKNIIEKPSVNEAPSNLAIAGRYVLTPDIFDYISKITPDKSREIQLTDAIRTMIQNRPMFGLLLDGKRCDIGNKDGFIITNIEFALKREDMAEDLRQYIKQLAQTL